MNVSILVAIIASLLSSSNGARILSLMYHNSTSHHIWMSSLLYGLAERGHEITSVDIKMPAKPHPNIRTLLLDPVPVGRPDPISSRREAFSSQDATSRIKSFSNSRIIECTSLYERSPYKELIKKDFNESFDLVLVNYGCNPCPFALLHVLNYPPAVILHPLTASAHCLLRMANAPIYQSSQHFLNYGKMPFTTWQRLENLAYYLYDDYVYFYEEIPAMDAIIKKHMGEEIPSLREISDHIAMVLINVLEYEAHPPFPANVIPVGGLHLKPSKPLPKDLQEFLDSATDGAIFVSFGVTYSQGNIMNYQKRDAVIRAFSRLRQKVLWKQDIKDMDGIDIPPNVKLVNWVPQHDILGHPNIVLFISHCGGLSVLEAAYNGVPTFGLGMPFFADQDLNAEKLVTSGTGLKMDITDVTEESLYQNITEMLTNPKFRIAADRSKMLLRNSPMKPVDKAVFWIELLAKHGEVPGMRLPVVQSAFPMRSEYVIILDIVLVTIALVLSFIIVLIVFWCLAKKLLRALFNSNKVSSTKKAQ